MSNDTPRFAIALLALLSVGCGASSPGATPGTDLPPRFSYPLDPYGYVLNGSVRLVPSTEGSSGLGHFSAPTLPRGLTIDPDTGVISGTIEVFPAAMDHVVTAVYGQQSRATATATIQVWPLPAASYTVSDGLRARTDDFWKTDPNWPTFQSGFGFCETASNSSLLGYALYRNTNAVSPLYNLFHAYDSPYPSFKNSSGAIDPFYLWRAPNLGPFWDFFRDDGYLVFPGTPDDTSQTFSRMYAEYEQLDPKPGKGDWPRLVETASWQAEHANYLRARENGTAVASFVDLHDQRLPLSAFGEGGRSHQMATAIDAGHLVLIMFNVLVYEQADPPSGVYLSYAAGRLGPGTPPEGHFNNVWSLGRPRHPSTEAPGQHWVYAFSYGTAPDGSLIFFIRNSWGSANGENGNYFMTSDFIDGSYAAGDGKYPSIVLDTWAIHIHSP